MIRCIADALCRPETMFRDQGDLLRILKSLTGHGSRKRILAAARAVATERSGMVRP